jgi:hypothetical protein
VHLRYSSGSAFRKTASPHALKHALYTDGLLIKSSCSGKLHSMESVSEYSAYLATAQGQLAFYSTCPACVPRCGCSHSPQTPKAVWQSHGLVNLGVAPQPVFLLACGLGSRAHDELIKKPPAGRHGHWRPVTPYGRFTRPGCLTLAGGSRPNTHIQPPKNLTPNPGINRGLTHPQGQVSTQDQSVVPQIKKESSVHPSAREEHCCPDQQHSPAWIIFLNEASPTNQPTAKAHFIQKNVYPFSPPNKSLGIEEKSVLIDTPMALTGRKKTKVVSGVEVRIMIMALEFIIQQ